MSHELDKLHHSERLHQKDSKIKRQVRIAKDYGMHRNGRWRRLDQPHRNHKTHILNCGDPDCVMCMNPRRAWGEKTMQERRHEQRERIVEHED